MQKTVHKYMMALLYIMTFFVMLPRTAHAYPASITVRGKTLNSAKPYLGDTGEPLAAQPSGGYAHYNPATGVLTLNNTTIVFDQTMRHGIEGNDHFTIRVVGENTIKSNDVAFSSSDGDDGKCAAIACINRNLDIIGEGTLNITSNKRMLSGANYVTWDTYAIRVGTLNAKVETGKKLVINATAELAKDESFGIIARYINLGSTDSDYDGRLEITARGHDAVAGYESIRSRGLYYDVQMQVTGNTKLVAQGGVANHSRGIHGYQTVVSGNAEVVAEALGPTTNSPSNNQTNPDSTGFFTGMWDGGGAGRTLKVEANAKLTVKGNARSFRENPVFTGNWYEWRASANATQAPSGDFNPSFSTPYDNQNVNNKWVEIRPITRVSKPLFNGKAQLDVVFGDPTSTTQVALTAYPAAAEIWYTIGDANACPEPLKGGDGAIQYTGSFPCASNKIIKAKAYAPANSSLLDGETATTECLITNRHFVLVRGIKVYDGQYLGNYANRPSLIKPEGGYVKLEVVNDPEISGKLLSRLYLHDALISKPDGDGTNGIPRAIYYGTINNGAPDGNNTSAYGYYRMEMILGEGTVNLVRTNCPNTISKSYGIHFVPGRDEATNTLTISGKGALVIAAGPSTQQSYGIYSGGVRIRGGARVTAFGMPSSDSYGFYADNTLACYSDGIATSEMTAVGETRAIRATTVDLGSNKWYQWKSGTTTTYPAGGFTSSTVQGFANNDSYKYVSIVNDTLDNPMVLVRGIPLYNGQYLANYARVTTSTEPAGGYVKHEHVNGNSTLIFKNAHVVSEGNSEGVYSDFPLTLNLAGSNTLQAPGRAGLELSCGIHAPGKAVVVQKDPSATDAPQLTVLAGAGVNSVGIKAASLEIKDNISLSASGSNSATGNSRGVELTGQLLLPGGSITLNGGTQAIFAGSIDFNGAWYEWRSNTDNTVPSAAYTSAVITPYSNASDIK